MNNFVNHLLAQKKQSERFNQRVAELQRPSAPRSRVKGLGGDIIFNKR
ncbi:hypothetical protein pEaSNUABM6_00088 [Erwinia phage pEa_SNUABM_6]|nr:hypothetical protein pEaSNUABM6_00088 [Erwinia phage pEa_SNUABM_6]